MANTIIQYVIVRGDLFRTMNWPIGAVIAQACHACCAVTHMYQDDEYMKKYLEDLDNMHKVVLEAPNEDSLKNLEQKLIEKNIKYKIWREQPENILTCLVLKPYPKQEVQGFMKKFKLFK